MDGLRIGLDDPRADDIRELLAVHLTFARSERLPQDAHALDVGDLVNPSITFVSARNGCQLLAVGALREIDDEHGEIKSMHTSHAARGQGIGASVLTYLVDIARERAYRRVSLETGSDSMFVPARSLYAKAGFVLCEPFGDYRESPTSTYMTLELAGVQCGPRPRSTPVSGGG